MLKVHEPLSSQNVDAIFECDILHLSGGNPYVFLENLKKNDLFEVIRARSKRGGIIVGHSAGAMLMTPTIKICDFDKASSPAASFDHSAIGLVDFEIHPHWGRYGASDGEIKEYSRTRENRLYCIPDGAGIAMIDSKLEVIGRVIEIKQGKTRAVGNEGYHGAY